MAQQQDEKQFGQQLQIMQILNGALLASVGTLAVVGSIVPNGAPENFPPGARFFVLGAVVMAVLSFVLPKFLIKSVRARKKDIQLQDLFTSFIMSLALSETVGIFGLLCKIETGDTNLFWILLVVSAALVAMRFPTRERMLGTIAAARAGVDI